MASRGQLSELPPELRRWEELLGIFNSELAAELGKLTARIARLLGRWGEARREGAPIQEGYAGITVRGIYERLVSSEWLLAEEMPEEFDRRAAMQEHLFLAPAVRRLKRGAQVFALIDCGPTQLGRPRVVQLALLLYLQQRAREAGTIFHWGVLQNPAAGWISGETTAIVRQFLRARTLDLADDLHRESWRVALAGSEQEEVWLVAGEERFARTLGAYQIAISETSDDEIARVVVRVGRHRREALLPLPPDEVCSQLLTAPFRPLAVAAPSLTGARFDLNQMPIFGRDGRRLAIPLEDGAVALFVLPQGPSDTIPKPRIINIPRGHRLLGIDVRRKEARLLSISDDGVHIHVGEKSMRGPLPLPKSLFDKISAEEPVGAHPCRIDFDLQGRDLQSFNVFARIGRGIFVSVTGGAGTPLSAGDVQAFHKVDFWCMDANDAITLSGGAPLHNAVDAPDVRHRRTVVLGARPSQTGDRIEVPDITAKDRVGLMPATLPYVMAISSEPDRWQLASIWSFGPHRDGGTDRAAFVHHNPSHPIGYFRALYHQSLQRSLPSGFASIVQDSVILDGVGGERFTIYKSESEIRQAALHAGYSRLALVGADRLVTVVALWQPDQRFFLREEML